MAPVMTMLTGVLLGSLIISMRYVLKSGHSVGNRIAEANERLHETAQSGMDGIRDIKIFDLAEEMFNEFAGFATERCEMTVRKDRNEAAMDSIYLLMTSIIAFGLVYFAIVVASLSASTLGVFLFAIFRLAPHG